MNLDHHSVGYLTGRELIFGLQKSFSEDSSYGIATSEELGCIDAPESIAAGGMYSTDTGGPYQKASFRGMTYYPEATVSNDEQHELLCATLAKLVDLIEPDELSLIAHHCGVKIEDFYGTTPQEDDLFMDQLRIAA